MSLSASRVASLLADPKAALLHEGPRGEVWRVPWDEVGPAVLKCDRPPSLRSRWGRALRGSRAARAASAARALLDAGLPGPEPLGVLEEGERSVFAARWIEGPTLSAALAEALAEEARALAEEAARLAARLHRAGFRCRDLKPPNLIVSSEGLVLVDLDDVRQASRVPVRLAWRNLAALDAYSQLGPRPLGVAARVAGLRAYALQAQRSPAEVLAAVLPTSRAKRARLLGS